MAKEDSKKPGRRNQRLKHLEQDWHKAELLELERLRLEQGQRRAVQVDDINTRDWQQSGILFKQATTYDGLGNSQAAIEHYTQFLEQYSTEDEYRSFATKRLAALS